MEANDIPIAGFWLQDWVGKRQSLGYSRLWWNWEVDD
jgi:alpha-glucosidase